VIRFEMLSRYLSVGNEKRTLKFCGLWARFEIPDFLHATASFGVAAQQGLYVSD
jgi:hypothetical protein